MYARHAVAKLYREGYALLKSGVGLIDIADKEFFQTDLFCERQSAQTDLLIQTLDKLNHRFGKGALLAKLIEIAFEIASTESRKSERGLNKRIRCISYTPFDRPYPTNDTRVLIAYATYAISQLYKKGYQFQKAGVGLIDITDKSNIQVDLFTPTQSVRSDKLMSLIDQVNSRFGRGTLFCAAEGAQKKWSMKQERKSASFTVSWKELPLASCE